MKLKQSEAINWMDWMRVIACFLVVLAHVCDHFVARFDTHPVEFLAGVSWGAFYRPCVPLFTLMSGYLLLPAKLRMGAFYRQKMRRILPPFLFWLIVSPLLFFAYFSIGATSQSPCIDLTHFTSGATINRIAWSILNFSYSTTPLWYLYMLIGIYLFIPIISAFLRQATQKEVQTFLKIWLITLILPYLRIIAPELGYTGAFGNMGLLGECDWNPYGTFYYFSGFVGYLVLGYYFKTYPPNWNSKKLISITLPMWLIGYAITYFGFLQIQRLYPGDYSKIEIIWYFNSINVLMMTLPIFLWVRQINWKSTPLIRQLASVSFGVFLCHFFFVQLIYDWLYPLLPLSPYLMIPLLAIVCYALTSGFALLISLTRWGRAVVE